MPNGSNPEPAGPSATAGLALTTFGPTPALYRDGVLVLGAGKPLALVVYLAVAPGHGATREFLLDLLWSDLEPDRARHALRQTLWFLRHTLGESFIDGREELVLRTPIDLDRDRFLAAVERGDPEAAVAAYPAHFLPGFALPGSTDFEQWADVERDRLRAAFIRAGEMVVRRRLTANRPRDAVQTAKRIRDADRLNDTGWRLLLESLVAAGDTVHAAIEADAFQTAFQAEGRDLEPATRRLIAAILRAPDPGADGPEGRPELVAELIGREHQFAEILETWHSASRGPAVHLHLSGGAGLGKSRLINDVAHRLATLGARTVVVRVNPGDREVNYAFAGELALALADCPGLTAVPSATGSALVDLAPGLSRRFPIAPSLSNREEPLRLRTAALSEALNSIAEEQPIAILIDDVHWLDDASHRLLQGVLARVDSKILIVTTGRPSGDRVLEAPTTVTITLAPLSPESVAAMITSLGRWPADEELTRLAEAVHRAGGGSPLLVLETLQLALDQATLSLTDGVWHCPDSAKLWASLDAGAPLKARFATLDREAAWILLLLSTAGSPLANPELAAGVRVPELLPQQLWNLERHGFVKRVGSSWQPAHDEIAATCLELESRDRRQAAHAAISRILAGTATAGIGPLIRATRHAAASGDDSLLRTAFRRLVAVARQSGDPRSYRALAAESLGGSSTPAQQRSLVASLSWRTRLHLVSPLRIGAAAGAILLIVAGAIRAWTGLGAPVSTGPTLILFSNPSTGPRRGYALRVDPGRIANGQTIRVEALARSDLDGLPADVSIQEIAGSRWVGSKVFGNVETSELLVGRATAQRRPVPAPRDDDGGTLSPDGRMAAFSTARWTPAGDDDADIAILDLTTDSIRPLVTGRPYDVTPKWSADGARIGFRRQIFGGDSEICWTTFDGTRHWCRPFEGLTDLIGWISDHEILVIRDALERRRLVVVDVDGGSERTLDTPNPVTAVLSGDGQWIACECQEESADSSSWMVFPLNTPQWRFFLSSDQGIGLARWRFDPASRMTRPVFDRTGDSVPTGASYALRLSSVDPSGRRVPVAPAVVSWASSDPTVATVDDSSGTVQPRRPGQVRISASVGGWATVVADLTVVPPGHQTELTEAWDDRFEERWRLFGSPAPTLAVGPGDIRGFLNNGDGSFQSGAYLRTSVPSLGGLGFETTVSIPMNREHWQQVELVLTSLRNDDLATWDHRTAGMPEPVNSRRPRCSLSLGGEGKLARTRGLAASQSRSRRIPLPTSFYDGSWHRVRLQIFPDGTCGVAIDGAPRWRFRVKLPVDQPFRPLLFGNSAGTRILVGPIELWRGVRPDIEWDSLP